MCYKKYKYLNIITNYNNQNITFKIVVQKLFMNVITNYYLMYNNLQLLNKC